MAGGSVADLVGYFSRWLAIACFVQENWSVFSL